MPVPPFRPSSAQTPEADLPEPAALSCDTTRKFVRVLDERLDGLVFFEFSIGWPELAVELMLPRQAFDEFCAANRVQRLDGEPRQPHPEETPG